MLHGNSSSHLATAGDGVARLERLADESEGEGAGCCNPQIRVHHFDFLLSLDGRDYDALSVT